MFEIIDLIAVHFFTPFSHMIVLDPLSHMPPPRALPKHSHDASTGSSEALLDEDESKGALVSTHATNFYIEPLIPWDRTWLLLNLRANISTQMIHTQAGTEMLVKETPAEKRQRLHYFLKDAIPWQV